MKFTFQPESRPLDGYTLKRGIARGGFGEVYYALSDAGKEVAVKLLQHNLDVELRGVQQCLNLRHPNLVTIFDVKTDSDNDHWVVMEYIGGQTLEQILVTQNGPLPIDQIEKWLIGLTGGLSYLHDRGIVHRDVKPGNIFWDQGSIKLGDVGLSKFMTPSRRSAHTESVGTVYYMAPEVTYGKYGYEVDIYSVGVMLYEMLTGKLPFDGQSTGEILMKHLSEPPDLSIVSSQYRPLLAAALEKDPKKRTGSMTKLMSDFQQARRSGSVPISKPPQQVPQPMPRQSGFAKWMPPTRLPEPSPVRQPGMAGTLPVLHPISQMGPIKPIVASDFLHFTMGFVKLGIIGFGLLFAFAFVDSVLHHRADNPVIMLMFWPLAFAAVRLLPLVRTPEGYRAISTTPLIRFFERQPLTGDFISVFRTWSRSAVGYWTAWTALYLAIQIPLLVVGTMFGRPHETAIAGKLLLMLYGVFAIPLMWERTVLQRTAAVPPTNDRLHPANAANQPDLRQHEVRPVPQSVEREQRRGYRPVPPLTPVIQTNQRLADLAGSLNWATVLTLLFGLGTGFLSPLFGTSDHLQPDLGKLGLFTMTTLVGVWAILITSRLAANYPSLARHQRVARFITGVAVGSGAWWLSQVLLVDLTVHQPSQQAIFESLGRQPLAVNSEPTLLAFCIFFGSLFAMRRWWWHADPLRPGLFRISSVLLTVAVAFVLPKVFLFPFDWAVTWAAVMSCVVQLSAKWVPLEQRVRRAS